MKRNEIIDGKLLESHQVAKRMEESMMELNKRMSEMANILKISTWDNK